MDRYRHGRGRRSIRLPGFDYTSAGAYFLTIRAEHGLCLFGDIRDGEMFLSEAGKIAEEEWLESASVREEVELDRHVVMPNHVHAVVWLKPRSTGSSPAKASVPLQRLKKSLGSFVGGYKSKVTSRINSQRSTPGGRVWQRNYWEHIVRSERALEAIRRYIEQNPARWALDRYNPDASDPDPMAQHIWKLLKE